jgi:hypothetical protein
LYEDVFKNYTFINKEYLKDYLGKIIIKRIILLFMKEIVEEIKKKLN